MISISIFPEKTMFDTIAPMFRMALMNKPAYNKTLQDIVKIHIDSMVEHYHKNDTEEVSLMIWALAQKIFYRFDLLEEHQIAKFQSLSCWSWKYTPDEVSFLEKSVKIFSE